MTQKSLPQTFNESAAAAQAAFPEKLDNLLVLVTSSDTPIYVSPEIAEHVSKNAEAVKEAVKEATEYMRDQNAPAFAGYSEPLVGVTINKIALNIDSYVAFSSPRFTLEMKRIVDFDHEIGHLIAENGLSYNEHLSECAAEAYAILRHVQRFGKETDVFEYYNRAYNIVLGTSPIHYTDNVIQRIRGLVKETDVSVLSLRETAERANEIALACSLDDKTLKKICTAFQDAQVAYKKAGRVDNIVIQKCMETMLKHRDDPDIYKAGKRFLEWPALKRYFKNNSDLKENLDVVMNIEKERAFTSLKPHAPSLKTSGGGGF